MAKMSGWIAGAAAFVATAFLCGSAFAADNNTATTAISADSRAAGMKAAPALVKAANLNCTVGDAREIGSGTTNGAKATYYEVACKEGGGYVLGSVDKQPVPSIYNCLQTETGADGKPSNLACKLPGNANTIGLLQPLVADASSPCQVDKGRFLGSNATSNIYEAACTSGAGYIAIQPKAGGAAEAQSCLAYAAQNSNIKCTLTTDAQELSVVDQLAAQSGKCAVKDKRYVLTSNDGTDYFEVSCQDGKGYMLHEAKDGKLAEAAIPCANASYIGGGCTLTDARAAMTAQTNVYTDLAKKGGFDCNVSKYADFPNPPAGTEVVELACSNRPDGGVGFFPTSGAPRVALCITAEAEGFKCSYTEDFADYPKLTADLRADGKSGCTVNGARAMGHSSKGDDFIEVSCSDGGPGYVMDFDAQGKVPADGLFNCVQAKTIAGGCQLPTNTKS